MKIETPQILWHNGSDNDNGKNAPLYSLSLLTNPTGANVLATAGNSSEVHLWKIAFVDTHRGGVLQPNSSHKIQHMLSLLRHDRSVNVVQFSPNGLHLATAGDGNSVIVWSVSKKDDWFQLQKEGQLQVKIISMGGGCEGICDLQWNSSSNALVLGTIDHTVMVYELDSSGQDWKCAFCNGRDHTAYVQGVTYDPRGLYVASMSSDRTVRVYQRKLKKKKKKQSVAAPPVLQPNNQHVNHNSTTTTPVRPTIPSGPSFTDKLELVKAKTLKYRQVHNNQHTTKQHLFADECTMESFFRRLCWTPDGAFLVTPAALWHDDTPTAQPSFATYLFARHEFDDPYKVLPGLEKPSVAIRPNPVLFQLPPKQTNNEKESTKENSKKPLPYRSVFCVLTLDTVLVYDTHHSLPLCIARGLHYAGLTDATWSADGRHLLVSSTDGYISILTFDEGELGLVYQDDKTTSTSHTVTPATKKIVKAPSVIMPPCEAGQSATIEAPPAKRAKTRITPTLVSAGAASITPHDNKRAVVVEETEQVGNAVTNLQLEETQPKKKKRITPVLLSVD